jgi:hypothetical protein
MILGFNGDERPDMAVIRTRLDSMLQLGTAGTTGSSYLNERFVAAAHVLGRSLKQ